MKRTPPAYCILITLILALAALGLGVPPAAEETAAGGLGDLFTLTRGVVRDTNGDGLADTVVARVMVPARPAAEDVLAASNIAARLGFETMAMSLPLVLREDAVGRGGDAVLPILVGREHTLIKKLAAEGKIDLKSLSAGQGLIAIVPSPFGGPDGIAVAGGDDEGTLAAANELAARLPRAWAMSGIKLPVIGDQALGYLRGKGVAAATAAIRSMVVDADRRGIARIDLRVQVPDAAGARAIALLEDLDRAHRRGLEPRTLDFANVAVTA